MAEAVEIIEDDPIEVRRAKREALIAAGIDPYGHSVKRSHSVGELNEKYAHLEDGESTEDEVLIAGRVMGQARPGQNRVSGAARVRLRHSAVLPHQRARRGGLCGLVRFGRGRLDCRAWHHDAHEARAAVRGGGFLRADEQVAAASA